MFSENLKILSIFVLFEMLNNVNNFLNNFVRMPEGNGAVTLRFLPPSKGSSFYCATRTHRMSGRNVHCPRELEGARWLGKCSVCEYYNWLWRESEKDGVSADEADAFQTNIIFSYS